MTATLFLLFASHVLQVPERAGPLLLAYFAAGIVSVPVWVVLPPRHRPGPPCLR